MIKKWKQRNMKECDKRENHISSKFHMKYQGNSVPLQAWSGQEVSRRFKFPDYVTMAQDGGKVVSLRHRP